MRMRLRAPDEPEAESSYERDDNNSAPSTPDRSLFLPPLDVGSPEYIEERLENLKRRPTWGNFLDQYVQDHMDSDSDNEAEDYTEVSTASTSGFIRSTLWSLLVVMAAPLLIFCVPCLRHKSYGFWPLGCRSIKELFGRALIHVIFIVFGLGLLYWTVCRELPDIFCLDHALVKLNVQILKMIHAVDTCHAALLQWDRAVAQKLCMPAGIDIVLLLVNTCLLLHCHCRWARYLMVLMAVMFVVDMPTKLYDVTFPAPEIHMLDPNFALVNEEVLVALDGKNLKHGGSVAWVAYWGCAITANIDACEKQFVSTFEAGNVAVTFKSLDHFIPCYRDPPNPLKAQDYQCFEYVRIRVKEKHSIPGWSRLATQTLSKSMQALPPVSDEWLNRLEISSFQRETESQPSRISHAIIKPTKSRWPLATFTESMEATEADICVSSSECLTTESDGPSALGKEPVELSSEGDAEESEGTLWSSQESVLERGVSAAGTIAEGKLVEAEVTPDTEMKMIHATTESNVDQSDDATPLAEGLQQSSYTEEVMFDKSRNQVDVVSAKNAEETEHALEKESDVLGNERVRAVDDKCMLSTTTEILDDEEKVQATSRDNPREREYMQKWNETLEQARMRLP
ncbi:unnamed protein product [Peronospora farinosa]|uniref:Uncharacterized protein n=1 Tax=Peronospora farinosa TaxID=134698 RepID=A0AAV0T1S4_9STRA|nr:unnamed protein product [Peronospora farinosa]CAI5710805.1 unnamed protein product [Peronospora farinosa]